ncbi:MAG: hypothetical protein ABI747_01395 [Candidatus Moraniibacteriota bacterium]
MFEASDIFPFLGDAWQIINHSVLFTVLRWLLMLYAIVLIADVVLLLLLRGVTANLKLQFFGTERPLVAKNSVEKRWKKIAERLDGGNPSQYKVAVLEADRLADELLTGIGYAGKNMGERLASIHPGQLESFESLKAAHEMRNRIVNEPNFSLTKEEAEKLLESYRSFMVELELF